MTRIDTIKPHLVIKDGKPKWKVNSPRAMNAGKQRQAFFNTKEEAEAHAKGINGSRGTVMEKFAALLPMEQARVAFCLELLEWDVVRLERMVRVQCDHAAIMARKTLCMAIAEFLASKAHSGKRQSWLTSLAWCTREFAKDRENVLVCDVLPEEVEDWLNDNEWAPRSRWNRWMELNVFFGWCLTRSYCSRNIVDIVEEPSFDKPEIKILSVENVEKLMIGAQVKDPEIVQHLALMLFGGIRPAEVQRLSELDMKGDAIRILPATSKTRQNRWVTINPTLKAWQQCGGALPVKDFTSRILELRRDIGITDNEWQSDILRHTFVSYAVPVLGMAQTALEAGHSELVLLENYRSLAKKQDAERFWKILPASAEQLLGQFTSSPQPHHPSA